MAVKVKFQSEWNKPIGECTFPEDMPHDMRIRVINRRRQVMVYAYLQNGVGEELIGSNMYARICRDLQMLQAAWGHEFNFYDFQFAGWDETREDHLFTNLGMDQGVVDHAMLLLSTRKKYERNTNG